MSNLNKPAYPLHPQLIQGIHTEWEGFTKLESATVRIAASMVSGQTVFDESLVLKQARKLAEKILSETQENGDRFVNC